MQFGASFFFGLGSSEIMPNTALRESLIAVYCCVLVGVNSSILGLGLLKIYPEKLVKLLIVF